MYDTGFVNIVIYDTGLKMLPAHANGVSRRVLDHFGYMMASMTAVHHTIQAVAASGRAGKCAVNVPRCRKQGICDTGVVKKALVRLFTTPV